MAPQADKAAGKRPRTDQGSSSRDPPPYTITRRSPPVWPRDENTLFAVEFESEHKSLQQVLKSKEVDSRELSHRWDNFNSLLYNEWHKVPMTPTKRPHHLAMAELGITEDVKALLQRSDLEKFVGLNVLLWPDLVRQFFSSVRLFDDATSEEAKQNPASYKMSFMANGKRYVISAKAICRAFEFPEVPAADLPSDIDGGVQTLWSRIATGPFVAGSSTHSDIRHPVVRYLVRLLSTTILCKLEPGKIRKHELVLLSYLLRDLIPNETWASGFQPNLALVLMDYLHSLRHTSLSAVSFGTRTFTAGNLLTPIFTAAKVSFDGYSSVNGLAFVNMEHMKKAHWVQIDHPLSWIFPVTFGQPMMVAVRSVRHLMRVTQDPTLLFFDPPAELLRPVEATRKQITRRPGTSRASASGTSSQQTGHQHVFPSAPRDDLSDAEWRRWATRALQATWDALSCRSACARPRTPSPSPDQQHDSPSDEEADD